MARMLVVDDSHIMRKNIQTMLIQAGHTVVATAENGLQAFHEYEKTHPDLVTMDLAMPGMDGIEAMKKIISAYPKAKIVVISAIGMKEKVVEAIENGASHFLVKPITFDKLVTVVKEALWASIDKQRRIQMLERVRAVAQQRRPASNPSYSIKNVNNKYHHLVIKTEFDQQAAQALQEDIEELLFCPPLKLLIDFGELTTVDPDAFVILNQIICEIKTEGGMLRALANNQALTEQIQKDPQACHSGLNALIRYLPSQSVANT